MRQRNGEHALRRDVAAHMRDHEAMAQDARAFQVPGRARQVTVERSTVADQPAATARSSAAMSIFRIVIIAPNARAAVSPPALISSVRRRGVICQLRP